MRWVWLRTMQNQCHNIIIGLALPHLNTLSLVWVVQFQPHWQVLHFIFTNLGHIREEMYMSCVLFFVTLHYAHAYSVYLCPVFYESSPGFWSNKHVFFKSNTAWDWIRRQIMKWLYHRVLGTQRMETLPCCFFPLDLLHEVRSEDQEQGCPLHWLGIFEKAQYSDERNLQTSFNEEALWQC